MRAKTASHRQTPRRDPASPLAYRWMWRVHGRGFSTTVGVHTRELLVQAFKAGYRAGKKARK